MATLVEAYLERLGLPAACLADGPTLPLLETLVEAHLATLPFSNLSQHLAGGDAAPSLSPSRLQEKLLARRHGGNCFELNGLFALLLRDIGLWLGDTLVLPVVLGAAGSIVIWARADEDDRRRWTSLPDRFPGHAEQRSPASPVRLLAGLILIGIGVTAILATNNALLALRSVGLAIGATLVGAALVFGPWISRLVGDLTEERRERIRSEERAEVAAHLHDSVLQTLALIQRSADQPRRMVALARSQERELRAWLYDQRELSAPDATLRGLLDDVLAQVEAAHELDVELVIVGDAAPDEDVRALVAAVREALTNAGKHAGVTTASVYVGVVDDDLVAFVRDRGAGFDADAIAGDRRGIADSIRGRLRRHGGTATLHTAPGEGTEWEFVLPLRTEPSDDPTEAIP